MNKAWKKRFEFVSSNVFIHNISGSPNAKHCMAPLVITFNDFNNCYKFLGAMTFIYVVWLQ